MSICAVFAHSKIETPKTHMENAIKITQIADKGKSSDSPFSNAEKAKEIELSLINSAKNRAQAAEASKAALSKNASNNDASSKSNTGSNSNNDNTNSSKPQIKGVSPNDSNYASLVAAANRRDGSGKKDRYQTDPIPAGMPTPVEPQDVKIDPSDANYCMLSISCKTILNNMGKLDSDKKCEVPSDGIIYSTKRVVFYKGESVFDVLKRETAKSGIQLDFQNTPIYNSEYIKGIHNLYEFDCGNLSGWMYKVNGWFPNYGCSRYAVKSGDNIEWEYTCDLGRDVGCTWLGDAK